ncbi:hypothetical protein ACFL3S_10095 [Gemmatimonadota bacterium]
MRCCCPGFRLASGILGVWVALSVGGPLVGQTTKLSSTLRYGSGYLDVPAATVLPHLALTGTLSTFKLSLDNRLLVDAAGRVAGEGAPRDEWMADASVAVGLFDRVELGASLQSVGDAESGGTMVGGFGRLALLRPREGGLGLALGARYVSSPAFDSAGRGEGYLPPRLGFPDSRFKNHDGRGRLSTNFSPYVVGSILLQGPHTPFLLDYDLTLSVGFGAGMFTGGEDLSDWYSHSDSDGWMLGSALHLNLGAGIVLNLLADYNGFDLNLGAQLDLMGFRLGAFALGTNHGLSVSEYRSTKFGALLSVALCSASGGRCRPHLLQRQRADTVILPAPPPDTVVLRQVGVGDSSRPQGVLVSLCLATGEEMDAWVTVAGDTLVGANRTSIGSLRPGVAFAGTYAENRDWFTTDEPMVFDGGHYRKSGRTVDLDCAGIGKVGDHQGVPLFALRGSGTPHRALYVPVRAGVWQEYRREGFFAGVTGPRPAPALGLWRP